jgi:hypothetical protein
VFTTKEIELFTNLTNTQMMEKDISLYLESLYIPVMMETVTKFSILYNARFHTEGVWWDKSPP